MSVMPEPIKLIKQELDWNSYDDDYDHHEAWTDMQECDYGCGYDDTRGNGFGNGNGYGTGSGFGYDVAIRIREMIKYHGGHDINMF